MDQLTIKGDVFWKWRALSSDYERLAMMLSVKSTELNAALAASPEIKALIDQRVAAANEASVAKSELLKCQEAIELKYKINLKDCAIDDKTGRVFNLKDSEPVPVLKKKKG